MKLTWVGAALGFVIGTSVSALASPTDTAWLEDVYLQPSGPPELQFGYDYYASRRSSLPDLNAISLRSKIGFDRAPLDFVPAIGLLQDSDGTITMDFVELKTRFQLAGTPGEPIAVVYAGYRRVLRPGWYHLLEQGIAGRWVTSDLAIAGDLSVREGFGPNDTVVELRPAVAVTYGLVLDLIRFGVESFAVIPLTGQRFSDYSVGGDPEGTGIYIGPSFRMNLEYMWFNISAVTGRLTSDGASIAARATVAAQF